MTTADELRTAIATAMPAPWTVATTDYGLEVRMPNRVKTRDANRMARDQVEYSDDTVIEVRTDAAAQTIDAVVRREKEQEVDVAKRTTTGYRRIQRSSSYSGTRSRMTFSRTPDGLVRNTDDPEDTDGRLADIIRVAETQGWRSVRPAPAAGPAAGTSNRKLFIVVGIIIGGFVLIGGAAIALFATVFSAIAG